MNFLLALKDGLTHLVAPLGICGGQIRSAGYYYR